MGLLAHAVSDLCLGKPALRSLPLATTVADTLSTLKLSDDNYISVWSCDHSSAATNDDEDCHCKRWKTPVKSSENPSPASPKSQSRPLFSDNDEIRLLKAFYKLTKAFPSPVSLGSPTPSLTAKSLYGDFSHAQVTQKLRSLRAKYHKIARTTSLIKTPHQRQIYEIACKIWGKSQALKQHSDTEQAEPPGKSNVCPARKEEAEVENFPILMQQFSRHFPGNEIWREGLRRLEGSQLRELNKKWMLLEVEEAGILAKKAELSYELTKLIMVASVSSSNN